MLRLYHYRVDWVGDDLLTHLEAALAAVGTAFASFFAHETAAECGQAALQAATAVGLSLLHGLRLVLHLGLTLGRTIVLALRGAVSRLRLLRVTTIALGRTLLVVVVARHLGRLIDWLVLGFCNDDFELATV
ncbi:hypothetical protein F4818DRAFT_411039 [Hypoxylon cercidicola]|nr:hypothetical protein F4818DRAFT_411039 [Hypoxylon cercidicola]